jgi:drug/metabolite transporter (DMT)-like permease
MLVMTYAAQYGVTHLPVHRSAVIFLFEIVAGAVSAALLTNELVTPGEWAGGLLVVLAAWITAIDTLKSVDSSKKY